MDFIKKVTRLREFMIFLIVLGVFVIMTFSSPFFLTTGNLLALMLSLAIQVIIAIGMTNLMVSGGFDMSVGSVVAFTGAAAGWCMQMGLPTPMAVLAGIAVGGVIGFLNGIVVAKIGINPFVTTLASLSIFRGMTLILTQGQNISGLPKGFTAIGQTEVLGIQSPIWYAILLVIVGDIFLRKSRFFRQNYYIGGNEKAARLSGIPVDRIKILNYVIVGLLSGFAGIVMTSRLATASVTAGSGLELQVITAVIIGGASLQGGEGTVIGAFLGCLLMGLISNALTLLGVDVYWQTFITGATLLVAVLIDRVGKIRKERKNSIKKGGVSTCNTQATNG